MCLCLCIDVFALTEISHLIIMIIIIIAQQRHVTFRSFQAKISLLLNVRNCNQIARQIA